MSLPVHGVGSTRSSRVGSRSEGAPIRPLFRKIFEVLKNRSFRLKLPERRLVLFPIIRMQMVDEEDAVQVVNLMLGGT